MSASKAVGAVPERPAVMGRYKPYWTETPDSDDMSSFYPARAQRHDINGRVTLRCQVGPDGRLNACQVRAEAPQGEGFGVAALSLSEKFRMLPPDIPAGHAPPEITIPIVFEIPN
jgi:TonB family protein